MQLMKLNSKNILATDNKPRSTSKGKRKASTALKGTRIPTNGKRTRCKNAICLFSHFDPNGKILPYVLFYLRSLRKCGVQVYFISTSPSLSLTGREKAQSLGIKVFQRENKGRDFGSWQWGIQNIHGLNKADWIIFANDTVFGPFYNLKPILERGFGSGADIWGMTDSFENAWHLQSYFFAIRGKLLHQKPVSEIFSQRFDKMDRNEIIRWGEIEISQAMLRYNYNAKAMYAYEDLAYPTAPLNPYFFFWRPLIEELKYPFLKFEHIRNTKARAPDISNWRNVIAKTGYNINFIDEFSYAQRPRAITKFLEILKFLRVC